MKKFTNKEQTQHLIELGFDIPNYIDTIGTPTKDMLDSYVSIEDEFGVVECYENYSIGELLSFLEEYVDDPSEELLVWKDTIFWYVRLSSDSVGAGYDEELINALYKYIVELKEDEQNHGND